MKIQIDVRWPRFLRDRPRWARFTVVGLVAAGVLAVPVAWANHDFTDVPAASPFHLAISAVKSAGITSGKTCVPPGTPPTYCPAEDITREAMAAFVQRGMGRSDRVATTTPPALPDNFTPTVVTSDDLVVGGVAGQQFVLAEGWISVDDDGIANDTFCEIRLQLVQDIGTANEVGSNFTYMSFDDITHANVDQTQHVTWLFDAVPSGRHTWALRANVWEGCDDSDNDVDLQDSGLIVTTFAFNGEADGSVFVKPADGPKPTGNDSGGK